ncbi:MAG: (Fe-S)-binding protein, partial [Candidatus Thorarchaeota archaeon]
EEDATKTGYEYICPVIPYTAGFESDTPRGKIHLMKGVLEGALEPTDEMVRKFYECTQCGNCTEHCPLTRQGKMDPAELIRVMRSYLQSQGYEPPGGIKYLEHREPRNRRIGEDWVPEGMLSESSLVYFPGCSINCSVYYQNPEIAGDFLELMKKAGTPIDALKEGFCCGYELYITGQMEAARRHAETNVRLLNELCIETLVTTCAGCYDAFKHVYPELLGRPLGFRVVHALHLVEEAVVEGKLKLHEYPKTVTYHDTCDLGRKNGIYDPPRKILESVPEINLVEMEQNHENSWCCGAGGGVKSAYNDLAVSIGEERVNQAMDAGADVIVTSCPTCIWNLKDSAESTGCKVEVLDLLSLVNSLTE